MLTTRQLAVWGDPIEHSRSPLLHAAAYDVLGLDWSYGRRRVDEAGFDAAFAGLDAAWRGLSLTMPLKSAAHRIAVSLDRRAELTGAVNTLLLSAQGPIGFNTDVGGIVAALGETGIERIDSARIVGAGATASSAMVALAEMGARTIHVAARRPDAAMPLRRVADELGVAVYLADLHDPFVQVPVTVATLPGDAALAPHTAQALARAGGALLDVAYGTWPTALARVWQEVGGPASSGLPMLLHQALRQVRVFVAGDQDLPLDGEERVLAAMRRAIVGE